MMPYQVLPALSREEYEALKADIQVRGILVPVELDEEGHVLDGHHRLRAAKELGLKDEAIPKIVRRGLTEEQKLEHVLCLNLARRHLARDQKRELAVELRRRGWTQERIAAVLGVHVATVSRCLQDVLQMQNVDAESGKPAPLPTTITDTRGRKQPSTKPRKATPFQDKAPQGLVDKAPEPIQTLGRHQSRKERRRESGESEARKRRRTKMEVEQERFEEFNEFVLRVNDKAVEVSRDPSLLENWYRTGRTRYANREIVLQFYKALLYLAKQVEPYVKMEEEDVRNAIDRELARMGARAAMPVPRSPRP